MHMGTRLLRRAHGNAAAQTCTWERGCSDVHMGTWLGLMHKRLNSTAPEVFFESQVIRLTHVCTYSEQVQVMKTSTHAQKQSFNFVPVTIGVCVWTNKPETSVQWNCMQNRATRVVLSE